jgi:hypothetical protein
MNNCLIFVVGMVYRTVAASFHHQWPIPPFRRADGRTAAHIVLGRFSVRATS